MKARKGKIVECTESELYAYYLRHGWDDLYPFDEYKRRCEANGTKILLATVAKNATTKKTH